MGLPIHVSVELTVMVCGVCGGTYAIAERVREHHHQRGTCWNCPYCRVSWGYPDKGTLAAAERALAVERKQHFETRAALLEQEKRAKRLTRKLKRVENGVCPECNRHFLNLEKHMASQHTRALAHVGSVLLLPP